MPPKKKPPPQTNRPQGKKEKKIVLYKPRKSTRKGKKKMVYVRNKKTGKPKLIHYGDSSMQDFTQHGDKKRRASYLARSGGIKGANDKDTANYWARKDLWKA